LCVEGDGTGERVDLQYRLARILPGDVSIDVGCGGGRRSTAIFTVTRSDLSRVVVVIISRATITISGLITVDNNWRAGAVSRRRSTTIVSG
jgi:hypothetical protein